MFQSPRRYSEKLNLYKGGMKASCCTSHGEKSLVIDVYNIENREDQFERALVSLALLNFLEYADEEDTPRGKRKVYRMPTVVAHWLQKLPIAQELNPQILVVASYILYESLKAENPNDITDTYFAYPSKPTMELQRPQASCLLHHFKQISKSIQKLDKPKEPGTEVSPFECGILPPAEVVKLFLKVSAVLGSHSLCDEARIVLETIEGWLKITYQRIPEDHKINGEQYSPTGFKELFVKVRTALGMIAFERGDYRFSESCFHSILEAYGECTKINQAQDGQLCDQADAIRIPKIQRKIDSEERITIQASLYGARVQRMDPSDRDIDLDLASLLESLNLLKKDCEEYNKEHKNQPHHQTISILQNMLSICRLQGKFEDALAIANDCEDFINQFRGAGESDNKEREIYKAMILNSRGHIYFAEADRMTETAEKAKKKFQQAAGFFKNAATDYKNICGPTHAETLTCESDWARAEYRAGNLENSIQLYRQILLKGFNKEIDWFQDNFDPLPNIIGKWSPYFWANVHLQLAVAHICLYYTQKPPWERKNLDLAKNHINRADTIYRGTGKEAPPQYKCLEREIRDFIGPINKAVDEANARKTPTS
ncbi:hypothetical protein TWF191_009585 [Orbilia oligospora]|uniref:Uncharacterized protein n=1 Tax=Orbilia oligospora TaxID=2813651 RepID=A0A7C8UYB0_ORBOL|nr:hypothetical protein TWF191_009585 [Orbilia oligospora]